MAKDEVNTTMNSICKEVTKNSGSGEFGGEDCAPFSSHKQSKGADVIPIKTRDNLRGSNKADVNTTMNQEFKG